MAGGLYSTSNGITPITVGTARRPVLSIAPKLTFGGPINQVPLIVVRFEGMISSGTVHWEAVINGTLTGAIFNSVDVNSRANFDIAATAIAGGSVVDGGYMSGGGDTARGWMREGCVRHIIPLTVNLAGTVADTFTIVCQSFTGTVQVNASINWVERI